MCKVVIILKLTILFAVAFPVTANSKDKFISINTENTSAILAVDKDGQVLFRHYGGKVACPENYDGYNSWRRKDYGTDPLAYPASGGRYFNLAALSAEYPDGDRNAELKYISHDTDTLDANTVVTEILLQDKKGIRVTLVYTAYYKENVILAHSEITNLGKGPVSLHSMYSAALPLTADKYCLTHFYGSWAREMQVEQEMLTHGIKTIESRKGVRTTHTENPSFIISLNTDSFNENYGEAVAGALAWSGNFRLDFQVDETSRLNILAGINPYASEYVLERKGKLTTPDLIFTYSSKGAGQASRNLHDWARNYGLYGSGTVCPTLLNSWEGAYFDFDTATITAMIDNAKEMGLELFVLDDGWFGSKYPRNSSRQGLGDWEVNREKLPEGIGYLAEYAVNKGIRFGIWLEPEMVSPKSELAEKHPEWIVGAEGRDAPTQRNQCLLDLTNPEVRDYVFSVFDKTMQLSPHISYIKWDANRHVENFGSKHLDIQSHFWIDYVRGFYSVLDRIREKYPDVIIQACASGGGRVEYGALKYFNECWTSDNTEALSRAYIQYGTNLIYPACVTGSHVSAVPNHQTMNTTPLKFRFDMACSGRLGMELQPATMSSEEKEFSKMAIESYKKYRDLIFSGDLYRLKSPYESDYYAIMYVSKDKSRAVAFAYCLKYQGRTQIPQIRLSGLDISRKYRIEELNVSKSSFWGNGKTFDGDFLVNVGLNPSLDRVYESSVFYIEAVK